MRCFIAIELPLEIRELLYNLQKKIGGEYAKIKWVAKKNLHLTLKFLGELDEKQVELTKEALSNVKLGSFTVSLSELGWFPNDYRINVIWIGLNPERDIHELQGEIELKLGSLFEKDGRFSVHLTLGRVKFVKNKEKFLEVLKNVEFPWEMFSVKEFSLIKSDLTKDGPKYNVLERYKLG